MAEQFNYSLANASALFKIKYEKLSENVYNSANVLLGRCKKSYNFTGKQLSIAIPQSFAGGVGSGSLPRANAANYADAQITAKKMYAVVEIDRETIKAAMSDEGAFVRATKEVVKKGVEAFMRNLSRTLFSDGSGKLGTIDNSGVFAGTAAAPIVPLKSDDYKEANLEEGDLINIGTGNGSSTSLFEITAVDTSNKKLTLSRLTGTQDFSSAPGSDQAIFMQGSEGQDPEGLDGVVKKSDSRSSSYSINHGRRWDAEIKSASSAAISTDLLNEMMLKVEKKCGKSPNLIVCSYKQYEKILNLLEDQKRYEVKTRAGLKSKSGADISFSGIEFMSSSGPVGIFPERFVEDDRVYFLNDNHIHIYHRPDFGWFDDDGTVFLRKSNSDAYEARYGGYLNAYINPCFHGVLHDLSV